MTHLDTMFQTQVVGTRGTLNAFVGQYFNSSNIIYPGTINQWGDVTKNVTIDDATHKYELDYVITIHVLNGDAVHVMGYLGGMAATPYGDSFLNAMSTSKIDKIVIPDDATLTAASGDLQYSDGKWIYTSPVPEPATWILVITGLMLVVTRHFVSSRTQRAGWPSWLS